MVTWKLHNESGCISKGKRDKKKKKEKGEQKTKIISHMCTLNIIVMALNRCVTNSKIKMTK